jgi:Shugoshin C terminus
MTDTFTESVNTDPVVSPAKTRQTSSDKPGDPEKKDLPKARQPVSFKDKSSIRQIRPIKPATEAERPQVAEVRVTPVTPAPIDDDVFSPSSRPSTARAESRDTPPPGDLASSDANAAARPSRRQRSAVSYAEPSLRDKMRRPGKEMVDAVTGARRGSVSIPELHKEGRPSIGSEPSSSKLEEEAKGELPRRLKTKEPTSPLTAKFSSTTESAPSLDPNNLPASVLADRRRRSSALHNRSDESNGERRVSASQETIAALISSSNKKLARVGSSSFDTSGGDKNVSHLAESLSVFDLHLSSPPSAVGADESEAEPHVETKPRTARVKRHSSVSDLRGGKERESSALGKRALGEMEEGNKVDGSRRAERAERRRSMMV